ncbi:MAG: FecR family protein [Bacteroidota bacterium]|nr:FecR family protein [Bacteroidota bacterium]
MKDFRLFDISDFVMDEDFIRWVNEKKKADNDFWDNWLSQYPGKYMVVAEARRILESIGTEQKVISEVEKQHEIKRLMQTIRENLQEPERKAPVVPVSKKWWYVAAASLFLIASTFTYWFVKQDKKPEKESAYAAITSSRHLVESINTSGKAITLRLPDQSTVELAANSRIAYANNFDSTDTRDVYLSGEGFFKVTKNPARPFRVFANEIVTKVLGTSFIVRSFDKDSVIQVTVRTGKVSVYSQGSANDKEINSNQLGGIILTPNQELVYEKLNQKFQKALLENPVVILPDATNPVNMLYEDVSLEKVFTQLSKTYGINIVYDNELLKKCTVTADLRNETFYRKLELICKAVGARYEIIDGQVVVQSSGCD